MMKKILVISTLTAAVLATIAGLSSSEPSFSRSRWIAEQRARGAVFSGGVLPVNPRRVEALLKTLDAPFRARAGNPKATRVSFDTLQPDGGPAQPETQQEPYLAINPEQSKNLLAGYQDGRFVDGGCRALTFSVSTNGGRTWKEGQLPNLTVASGGPWERTSDPWVAFGPGNRAYFVSLGFDETRKDNGVFVSTSLNGGRTWGDPVTVHRGDAQGFDDKESMTVDTVTGSPFRGRVYVAWDMATNTKQPVLFSASQDGAASFGPAVTVYDNGAANIGAVPVVGPGGVVHLVWLTINGNVLALVHSRSADGGATWSPANLIAEVEEAEVEDIRAGEILPTVAVDPGNGNLYVAWQDGRFTPEIPQIALSRSTDGGVSWSEPQLVSDGPGDAPNFTPALAVSPEGWVGIAYYSLRNDRSRRFLVDEYLTVSKNGGQTFAKSVRVSGISWDVRFAALSDDGFFLGDYQGLAAARKTFYPLYIATFNTSRIDPPAKQPDAFTRAMKVK
jgi:hypothetical protein